MKEINGVPEQIKGIYDQVNKIQENQQKMLSDIIQIGKVAQRVADENQVHIDELKRIVENSVILKGL